ncbi:acyltransferase family protein [Sinirhodobacter sp. WL0062]|uniref:Acyltransferase family protein n=1 Tax=Rhodobacter flavimaris TaxID=2907145 RepID=A0ABS8YSQ2_9RHOB|nr:acyltransferase family protein [Sinirhodobacter sp. WL0062]MCE5972899.1 acyltransferase family protein [Sinirhodobacter sp. WL0062]
MSSSLPSTGTGKRLVALDLLKFFLALLVVTIHANPLRDVSEQGMWLLGNGLARVAVPGFFAVAGFNFRPEVPGRSARLVWRYLKLHLIWLTLYISFWWPSVAAGGLKQYLNWWIFGWWHLWFLTGLAVTVLAASLVWRWRLGAIIALIAVTFLIGYGIQEAIMLRIIPRGYWPAEVRNGILLGLPFFLLGYVVRRAGLTARVGFGTAMTLGLAGLGLAMLESWTLRQFAHPQFPLAPETLIAALLACPLLIIAAAKAPALPGWVARLPLGTYSTGIYFIHVGFVITLSKHFTLPRAEVFLIAVIGALLVTQALIWLRLDKKLF